ncbi:hypothetical protein LJK87_06660 [Paenibacillus sp. P25]|nr:hypothetical protein LJK87_06660 [Paenibacillus sp. P25]
MPPLPKAPLLIASNVLTTVGMFYFATVWNTRQFRVISQQTAMEQARILLWREWFLNLSRIVMLILILFVDDLKGPMFMALIALALISALLIPWFSRKGSEAFEQQQKSPENVRISLDH